MLQNLGNGLWTKMAGALDEKRIYVIRSSDFSPTTDPDDANPTETHFKKILNRWLKTNDEWLERIGERLYLFFAGHGFIAGSIPDPAVFTAQARWGDTAHIAAFRYASKIQNAGFFDEIVLFMDCCQDVLKAAQVGDLHGLRQTVRAPAASNYCTLTVPRADAKLSRPPTTPAQVHGYFSSVLMEAIRTAPSDAEGFVTARAVEDTFNDLWAHRYLKLTGYMPPFMAPRDMRLYRRRIRGGLLRRLEDPLFVGRTGSRSHNCPDPSANPQPTAAGGTVHAVMATTTHPETASTSFL